MSLLFKKKRKSRPKRVKRQRKKHKELNMHLLEKLISARGVSGDEDEVRDIIRNAIKPYVDELYIDTLGNLIAHKKGKRPRVMLAAHMDEIGLMLKRIDEKGIIYCSAIGGINPIVLIGHSVRIKTKRGIIYGVITCKELWAGKDLERIPDIEELMIDTGLSKKELLNMGVEIGTYLPLEEVPYYLGSKDIICGKALDDRTGCFILIELAKRLKSAKNDIYYVFTVQEEFGVWGSKASAFNIEPDWGIAVDVTHANDVFAEPTRILGNGPVITIKDGEIIAHKVLNKKLIDIAKKKRIPYQLAVIELGTTDAANISVSKGGVPSTVVGVLVRNIHTTISISHKKDIENTIRLLEAFLKSL